MIDITLILPVPKNGTIEYKANEGTTLASIQARWSDQNYIYIIDGQIMPADYVLQNNDIIIAAKYLP